MAGAKLLSSTDKLPPAAPVTVQFVVKNTSKKEQTVVLQKIETHPVLEKNNRLNLNVLESSQGKQQHKLAPGEVS